MLYIYVIYAISNNFFTTVDNRIVHSIVVHPNPISFENAPVVR